MVESRTHLSDNWKLTNLFDRRRNDWGRSKEELAVEPPFDDEVHENDVIADENYPFKFRNAIFAFEFRKLAYTELAIYLGCKTIWIPPKGNIRNPQEQLF